MSDTKEITVSYKIGDSEIKLTPAIMQKYLVGDAPITLPEFKMFSELCKVRKLNPFLKEAYCIKYGNSPATIVVSKDVYVSRAVKHPSYDGKESGIIVRKKDGTTENRPGCFFLPDEDVVGGWCKVYRKDRQYPEYMSVALSEVIGKKADGSINKTWMGKTATMVEKVAKVRALREAFIDELQGMYISEEMGYDDTDGQAPVYVDATPVEVPTEDKPQNSVSLDDL